MDTISYADCKGWDYKFETGVSEYNNGEVLHKFRSEVLDGEVIIDNDEIGEYLLEHPQPFQRSENLGLYADTHPEATEPYTGLIRELSGNGLKYFGKHGPSEAMGVDRNLLPKWEDIQFLPAQLARWILYRDLANLACSRLLGYIQQNNEIRIWPHYFDTGIFVKVVASLSIGFGLGMQDYLVDSPYFYLSGYLNEGELD